MPTQFSASITPSNSQLDPATLVDLLRYRSEKNGDDLAYTFLMDGEIQEESITYAGLDRKARAVAAWLQQSVPPGERALLLFPPGLDYIAAFFGCLYAGVIAVPAYPPRLNRPVPRIQGIVADCQPVTALTTQEILANLEQRFEHTPDLQALRWLDTGSLPTGGESAWQTPSISPQTLAFLQYTSGSTSQPKGVMLTHANLLYNLKMICTGFQLTEGTRGVSWLPSYHDMGLIGGILSPLFIGGYSVLMSPLYFLQRPFRWLEAISRFQGTVSGGPNFAYDLCVEKISPEQRQALDLSSWQIAFSGSEPVRPRTLERFAQAFASCGFRPQAYYPCYGLAEATLFVTGGNGPAEPKVSYFRRSALEHNRVTPVAAGEEDAQEIVSCGHPHLAEKLVIADPKTGQRLPADEIGEIWVQGPNIAQGYWNRPEETARTFGAALAGEGEVPFMRTGDLGFLYEGDLYVAGRLKDLIIIRGSNHYPQDIELTVESCHPALQQSGGIAFTIETAGEERLVVVQEVTRSQRNANLEEVFGAIRQAIAENHDLQVSAIVLVRPMSVPKTSSGKVQRSACKASFLKGELEVVREWRVANFDYLHS